MRQGKWNETRKKKWNSICLTGSSSSSSRHNFFAQTEHDKLFQICFELKKWTT